VTRLRMSWHAISLDSTSDIASHIPRDEKLLAKTKKYWFNTKTGEVEQGRKSLAVYRIGPFETREEAERAYEIIRERNKKLDQEDKDQS